MKGRASAVSLLQMATYSGLCVLVRLLAFRSGHFPLSLMEVLRDPHILKVGVGCYEDGKRLTRDYGLSMTCTVDLRYLTLRQRCSLLVAVSCQFFFLFVSRCDVYVRLCCFRLTAVNNGLSLKSLAADLLNVSLDKSLELRCSDWEADQLTLEQVMIHCVTTLFTFFSE